MTLDETLASKEFQSELAHTAALLEATPEGEVVDPVPIRRFVREFNAVLEEFVCHITGEKVVTGPAPDLNHLISAIRAYGLKPYVETF